MVDRISKDEVVLGLDVGPNSIGWALIDPGQERIIDIGVRIFREGVDNFDTGKEVSRNEQRRLARGLRRQIRRRAERRNHLRDALVDAGLFPPTAKEQAALLQLDPYELRARALDQKLTRHEIGRVFYHLNQRRGFKSNRKDVSKASEEKGMLAEISELAKEIMQSGARTLGEFLYRKHLALNHRHRTDDDNVRCRHTRRQMLEEEFDLIWETQATYYPGLLTSNLRYGNRGRQKYPCKPMLLKKGESLLREFGIHGILFFQRSMYWPKSMIGKCELEPKLERCPKADRHAQLFRMLQELNNLRLIDGSTNEIRPLTDEERALLLDHLQRTKELTFEKIRSLLASLPGSPPAEQIAFNLEAGGRSKLQGMVVDASMAGKNVMGKKWHGLPEEKKDEIVRLLIDPELSDDDVVDRLVVDHQLPKDLAQTMVKVSLPTGYLSFSLTAIDKLLPHLKKGLPLQAKTDPQSSALHAAGYLRRDELQRRIFDKLPDLTRNDFTEIRIGNIPNPVVKRALVELRKVVNAIIREYGRPGQIHLEMARSVKMGRKARLNYAKRMREREQTRTDAANEIRDMAKSYNDIKVTRDSIVRFILWKEQKHECIYCGKPISQSQLFHGDADVDHILPYSRSLDNSQTNKVVCHRECNIGKGNKTPFEWLASSRPGDFEALSQRALRLLREKQIPYAKYKKLMQKSVNVDEFIERQLVDTGYIARVAGEFLRCLFEEPHSVLGVKGIFTSELRYQWGLHSLLRSDDQDAKSRDDHRHHAIDAAVIALTDRSQIQQLSRIRKAGYFDRKTGEEYSIPEPWPGFRGRLEERIRTLNVSFRVDRKVAGALHEETIYGPGETGRDFVVRKPLAELSASEISAIRDRHIRDIVIEHLLDSGIDVNSGQKIAKTALRSALADEANPVRMPSGVPIKRVRILKPDATIQPIRNGQNRAFVKPGATHHLCVFEWEEGGKLKRDAEFVTMLEAARRLRNGREIIQRVPDPKKCPGIPQDARFVMSLAKGEMVLAELDGAETLLVVQTSIQTEKKVYFAVHKDARRKKQLVRASINTMFTKYKIRKVTVDPLGQIRWAND